MFRHVPSRRLSLVAVVFVALALAVVLVGCGDKDEPAATSGSAMGGLDVARSAISTMAPDAKLLLVQTATSLAPTETPVWAYLFGSPTNDKTYVVYVSNGKTMQAAEYGTAGLSEKEWGEVPGTDDWKIDSAAAYDKAVDASGLSAAPSFYNMGFLTYVPSSDETNTTKPFVWHVQLIPSGSGDATASVRVDAKTGAAEKQ